MRHPCNLLHVTVVFTIQPVSFSQQSLDIKDFDISFARGLSLEDGAATLTYLTAQLIREGMTQFISKK